jgi:hypothetical protein
MAFEPKERVRGILVRTTKEDLAQEETEAAISELLGCGKWPEVGDALLLVLSGNEAELWPEAVRFVYLLQGRGLRFEADPTIAILYDCLCIDDNLDGNLVWTITKDLKGESYLSDYDPFKDDGVMREMDRVRREREAAAGKAGIDDSEGTR